MRYAIYFTPPPNDALTMIAANWLGRDAFSGANVKLPSLRAIEGLDIAALTEEPRRYGFHATLKAPFRLAEGKGEGELLSALLHFSASITPFTIPRLVIRRLGDFFALVPDAPVSELNQLANDVVVAFDRFRAPLNAVETARRKPEKLTENQRHLLERWGYPYVFDAFRFHMTLTGAVSEKDQDLVERQLAAFFAPVLDEPVEVGNIALFVEQEPGAPFEVHSLHPLSAGVPVSQRVKPQHISD